MRVSGGGIFRARLRPEGYVSVVAGSLVTPPLRVRAGDHYVNSSGPVRVAVLSETGEEIGAAALKDDSLSHQVRFDGAELKSLAERSAVRLSFSVKSGGRLYAFVVR